MATGSVALYSDALESIVNVVTALVAPRFQLARTPADRHHQFGHHKAEYFSAVLEGVLIVVAALLILREAYDRAHAAAREDGAGAGLLINGPPPPSTPAGRWFLIDRGRRRQLAGADRRRLAPNDRRAPRSACSPGSGSLATGWRSSIRARGAGRGQHPVGRLAADARDHR